LTKKIPKDQLWFVFFLLILVIQAETNLHHWTLAVIAILGMLKYNMQVIFIIFIYAIVCGTINSDIFISNGILVTVLFVFNLIFILLKLHFRKASLQFT
jgi:hypothetical protein